MERWKQIESLFQEALLRPEADRERWLHEACHGDSGLRREVESLLANHDGTQSSAPWVAAAAGQLLGVPESLEPGDRLGPYQIVSFIASGGMGAVYRAHDPRTGRDVAIKVAGERFSERFSREVRVVAALNHPNICTLYDVGPNYLVMELVEGESPKGPLPIRVCMVRVWRLQSRRSSLSIVTSHGHLSILIPGAVKTRLRCPIRTEVARDIAYLVPRSAVDDRKHHASTLNDHYSVFFMLFCGQIASSCS
jgi:hypothetical protein